eukprot:9477370-Pyramimonas_sp.AAC.1
MFSTPTAPTHRRCTVVKSLRRVSKTLNPKRNSTEAVMGVSSCQSSAAMPSIVTCTSCEFPSSRTSPKCGR